MTHTKAKFRDSYEEPVFDGRLTFKIYKNGKLVEEETDYNLVVDQSRTFMRNLVANDCQNVITKIKIGDMNKTLADDCSNPPAPSVYNTDLVHTFFMKDFQSRTVMTDSTTGRPMIRYEFTILETEANDPSNPEHKRKLWCEFGLADANNNIWTRKVKPLVKDDETRIDIQYDLLF